MFNIKLIIGFLLIFKSVNSFSCSAPPPPSVEVAFKESKAVYLAVAKSIKVIPEHNEKYSWTDQEVEFEVLQSWKGTLKAGEKITYKTTITGGTCGVSVDNYDHSLEIREGKTLEERFPKFSGVWLIYAYEADEHSLNGTGRTRPLEFGGAQDLETLYKLAEKSRK